MLNSLRRHATGWVAKVLFGILVVSFAIWGIGDIFRAPHGGSTLAEVAGGDVSVQEVTNEFESRVRQMQEQFGASLDRRAAVSLGAMQQALDAAVARHLVDAHARDLQLTAADATVAETIRQNPSLQGTAGFERERFELLLRGVGMSEADYVEAVRGDLVRSGLIGSLTGVVKAPDVLARKLAEYRMEQRTRPRAGRRCRRDRGRAPGEEALAAYLAANAKAYEAPGVPQHHAG